MAQLKRAITKEHTIDHMTCKLDDSENLKRRKRSFRDEESRKSDEKLYYPQKKRNFAPLSNNRSHIGHNRQCSEDQDDETLIRETQAALKSLSGSWPEDRSLTYKINETDENPSFQNLFEEKNGNGRKMSPTISTTTTAAAAAAAVVFSNQNANDAGEVYRDGYSFREYNGKFKPTVQKCMQQSKYRCIESNKNMYQSHDFNELVDDSSNEPPLDISTPNAMSNNSNHNQKDDASFGQNNLRKLSDSIYGNNGYQPHRMLVPFSQSSAFKPPGDNKRNASVALPLVGYHHTDAGNYTNYSSDISTALCNNVDKEKIYSKLNAKDEDGVKSIDSPDSKHYTTLQPAGVGSKAASVMQDIAREGVLSVAAVSSTSSPGLNNVSSTSTVDKILYDRPVQPFSPGSISKGECHN